MNRKDRIFDEMKKIASQINVAKMTNQPHAKLKQRFAKLQAQYKPYWIKEHYAK